MGARRRSHAPSREYLACRMAHGKTRKTVMRCLTRDVAREIDTTIQQRMTDPRESARTA